MAGYMFFKGNGAENLRGEASQGARVTWSSPNGLGADKFYEGWIELNSVTQTVTRAIESGRSGTARARAGAVLEDIEVEKEVDCASAGLIQACSGGKSFEEVYIHLCSSMEETEGGQSLHPYLEFHMFAVKVTSYSINGSGLDDGSIPTETLSLNFDKIAWRYWAIGPYPGEPELNPNQVGKKFESGWDIIKAVSFVPPPN